MSTEENKALVVKILDALSNQDWEFINSVYAEDSTLWVAGSTPVSGLFPPGFLEQIPAAFDKDTFPEGIRFVVHAMTAEGDRVAVECESFALHASGKQYNNQYHMLYVIRDGMVQQQKEYMDTGHVADVICGI